MKTLQALIVATIVLAGSLAPAQPYSGGDGSSDEPYQISTAADWVHLTQSPDDWAKYFVLTADIDLAGIDLAPVAPDIDPDMTMFQGVIFSGVFDGQGFTVSNAVIHRPNDDFVALFGCVGFGGHIHNLRAENVHMTGRRYVAGLVAGNGSVLGGDSIGGTIADCHVSGVVVGTYSGASPGIVGGLCGDNYLGTIHNCSAAVTVIGGENISALGGLCAWNYLGTISNSYAVGPVSGGTGSSEIGGFCGTNYYGIIRDCYARGDVTGHSRVGGFIGYNNASTVIINGVEYSAMVKNCYATGKPTGNLTTRGFCGIVSTGGFMLPDFGTNFWDIRTSEDNGHSAAAVGLVTPQMKRSSVYRQAGWDFVGTDGDPAVWRMPQADYPQLAWQRYSGGSGIAGHPYQIGTVADWLELIQSPQDWGRHFVLVKDIDFQELNLTPVAPDADPLTDGFQGPMFTGNVDGRNVVLRNAVINLPEQDFAGLFGAVGTGGHIHNLGVENISVIGRSYAGGLAGRVAAGTISKCYTTGSISALQPDNSWVGGLVGALILDGSIADSYSTAQVSGVGRVGGLVGQLDAGEIARCYAAGGVSASGDNVGGLVGLIEHPETSGTIRDSYATGNVNGNANIGGLIGNNYRGKVFSSYATGKPTGTAAVGGFCGIAAIGPGYQDTGNFWNTTTSQTAASAMGSGKTTAEMQTAATFTAAGWDMQNTWWMPVGNAPQLKWELDYSGGDGTAANPFRIGNPGDWRALQYRPEHWNKHFVLIRDIDLEGIGLAPIAPDTDPQAAGFQGAMFTGSVDGRNYALRNAVINLPDQDFAGLFGAVGTGGQIHNLGVENISVIGRSYAGGLAGGVAAGTISKCYTTGSISALQPDNSWVGGLVGALILDGSIADSYSTAQVSGVGRVGGLVGQLSAGWIRRCYAYGNVNADGNHIGGLVGYIYDTNASAVISDCYAAGNVSGNTNVGGLVGQNYRGKVIRSYSIGKPTGTAAVGGLCGTADTGPGYEDTDNVWDMQTSQTDSSAMGLTKTTDEMKNPDTFTAAGWDTHNTWWIPGGDYPRLFAEFKGYAGGRGTTADPYRIGRVRDWMTLKASPADWNKEFVLISDIDFDGVELTPVAPDTDPDTAGFQGTMFNGLLDGMGCVLRNVEMHLPASDFVGLFGALGQNGALIDIDLQNVNITGKNYLGGLCGGSAGGFIMNCRTTGTVGGTTALDQIGGLVGTVVLGGVVHQCSSTCSVAGRSDIGGLVGRLSHSKTTESFAAGQVSGSGENIGGLVGYLYGSGGNALIEDCYAKGRVIGGVNVGGLIGHAYDGVVYRAYSTGKPTGTTYVGGVFGRRPLVYSEYSIFWDIQTSETSNGVGTGAISSALMGRPTFMMKTQATYSEYGWNFDRKWAICENANYPRLQWQIPAADWVCPDGVGLEDFAHLAAWWLADDCNARSDCDGTDLNRSGDVGLYELLLFADQWLQ